MHICPFLIYMLLTFNTFWFVFIFQWWRVILISAFLSSIFHSIVLRGIKVERHPQWRTFFIVSITFYHQDKCMGFHICKLLVPEVFYALQCNCWINPGVKSRVSFAHSCALILVNICDVCNCDIFIVVVLFIWKLPKGENWISG